MNMINTANSTSTPSSSMSNSNNNNNNNNTHSIGNNLNQSNFYTNSSYQQTVLVTQTTAQTPNEYTMTQQQQSPMQQAQQQVLIVPSSPSAHSHFYPQPPPPPPPPLPPPQQQQSMPIQTPSSPLVQAPIVAPLAPPPLSISQPYQTANSPLHFHNRPTPSSTPNHMNIPNSPSPSTPSSPSINQPQSQSQQQAPAMMMNSTGAYHHYTYHNNHYPQQSNQQQAPPANYNPLAHHSHHHPANQHTGGVHHQSQPYQHSYQATYQQTYTHPAPMQNHLPMSQHQQQQQQQQQQLQAQPMANVHSGVHLQQGNMMNQPHHMQQAQFQYANMAPPQAQPSHQQHGLNPSMTQASSYMQPQQQMTKAHLMNNNQINPKMFNSTNRPQLQPGQQPPGLHQQTDIGTYRQQQQQQQHQMMNNEHVANMRTPYSNIPTNLNANMQAANVPSNAQVMKPLQSPLANNTQMNMNHQATTLKNNNPMIPNPNYVNMAQQQPGMVPVMQQANPSNVMGMNQMNMNNQSSINNNQELMSQKTVNGVAVSNGNQIGVVNMNVQAPMPFQTQQQPQQIITTGGVQLLASQPNLNSIAVLNNNSNNLNANQIHHQQQQQQQQPHIHPLSNSQVNLTNNKNMLIPPSIPSSIQTNNNSNVLHNNVHPSQINNTNNLTINNINTNSSDSMSTSAINLLNQINYLINLPLTQEEEDVLSDYDCRLFGFLKLESNEQMFKRFFVLKAINCYEKRLNVYAKKSNSLSKLDRIQMAKLNLCLGHFYLLIYDYSKALSSYQKFAAFNLTKLQDSTFYYGVGIVYFLFGAFKFAEKAFLCALYKDPCFQRVNEIHFRLGLIYKHLEDYEQSLKHLKLALYDSSSSLSSISKAEIKYSIGNLFELNDNCLEALERYEDLLFAHTRQQQQPNHHSNDGEEKLDNKLKAKLYRQLGWLHYYSEAISKQNDKSSLAPIKAELEQYKLQIDSANQPNINYKGLQQAVDYLSKSAQLDPSQNLTWYYLGRVFASKGCSRESFICYKNSVNNPEATADTWASIGILYYHQKQQMDSLQAFICAIQLDRRHYAAWLNLGHLYEEDNQIEEALKCYIMAIKSNMHHNRMKKLKTSLNENEFQEFNLNFNELSQLDCLLKEFEDIEHNEEEFIYKDEYKLLINRAKSLITYFDSSADKIRHHLNRMSHNLPNLKEAFKLQIPIELKKKIMSMDINASNLSLASNVNKKDLKSQQQQQQQQQQQTNKNIPLNQSTHPNAAVTVQAANKQNANTNNRTNMKKLDQLVILKPNQIQLMNQLELNRNQLNAEQMQMLNYLKSQYFIMQSQQAQLQQQQQQQQQTSQPGPTASALPSSSPLSANQLKANAQPQHKQEQANTFNDLNFVLDQLPHDLENIQPITIMQEDITILHDSDINALLSRQDLVDIGESMDKSSLDQIFEKNPNTQQAAIKSMTSQEKNKFTFSSEIIKLDPTLLEGSMTTNKLSESNSAESIPLTDEEILNSKLSIDMTSDQILNACKSYGLNGIQNNSLLKPDRFGSNKLVLNFLNENELIEDKTVNRKKRKQENVEEESQSENDLNIEDNENNDDEDDDDDENGLDETLPYGSIAFNKTLINANLSSNKLNLQPPGPSVVLETKKDALSPHLQYFCLSHPISVVRGLSQVLRLDLGLFSTRSLVDTDPNHIVEVRTQRQQATDENIDWNTKANTWKCESTQSFTTVLKYAQYQAHSFQEAVKEEKLSAVSPNKRSSSKLIKFGTNVDLSDEKKWKIQLQELAKLPQFMRVVSSGNMLTHVGYKIYGVNTLQMYLKVPGCRTPGHQENNSFCSLNINIGPGDCEWFGVDEKYWMLIEQLCEKNSVDYLNGAWWPNLKELHDANIPVYRFLQKPGDLVWVNSGCVHWVQSIGWCNNVSWNIGPLVYLQYKSAIERYEWNKLKFYKSIVPMVHLSWNLARNLKITDRRLFEYIRYVLMHSLKQCQLAINYVENCGGELKYQSRQLDEPAHYCYDCDCEVFNILFVSEQPIANTSDSTSNTSKSKQDKQITMQHVVHCQQCARKRNHLLDNFVILHQYQMDELKQIYDHFQLYVPSLQTIMSNINNQNPTCTMHANTSSNLSITHTTSLNNSSNESNSNQNVKFY